VVPRQGHPLVDPPPTALGDFVSVDMGVELPELSSTYIRRLFQRKADCSGFLDRRVLSYIQEHSLYT
jgi:nicotinic acid mononucleotide adenylyltransferase